MTTISMSEAAAMWSDVKAAIQAWLQSQQAAFGGCTAAMCADPTQSGTSAACQLFCLCGAALSATPSDVTTYGGMVNGLWTFFSAAYTAEQLPGQATATSSTQDPKLTALMKLLKELNLAFTGGPIPYKYWPTSAKIAFVGGVSAVGLTLIGVVIYLIARRRRTMM